MGDTNFYVQEGMLLKSQKQRNVFCVHYFKKNKMWKNISTQIVLYVSVNFLFQKF